ncbi:NAD-dependent epimerase/dehydratase family protein [Hydrogenophaga flava]|uniref:NAD-dependent epimerase/dehydratase family protein n=1 Tax=Hydrogenophaga flava TaxID=65657 RepID=UPI000825F484|nr:NAD-dependent epimerase/dehydratase family protein [Hydrogenophaga flava]
MNVWLLGASGFVGRHVARALHDAGHTLVSRPRVDMARATAAEDWLPYLSGVDAVVNTVGVLRDSRQRPIWPTHASGPQALFDACASAGVRRVVQVSALGIEDNPTAYACSKRAADEHLLALAARGALEAVVLRPSIVVGEGGVSSGLFRALARWPWLLLPAPVARGRAQPLHVDDLAAAVVAGLRPEVQGTFELAGPEVFTLQALIAHWREALGHGPARVVLLPDAPSRWSARLGDAVPLTPWGSETLALLARPNTAEAATLHRLLGRAPVSVRHWPQAGATRAQVEAV